MSTITNVNWGGKGTRSGLVELVDVEVNGLELSLFPWEDPAEVFAGIEAMYDEVNAKPGIGFDDPSPLDSITVEQALLCIYDDVDAEQLLASIEAWLGCDASFGGISPVALDEAQQANVWDLFGRK